MNILRRIFLSLLAGALAGLAAALILFSLEWATRLRTEYPVLIWSLPVAGLMTGYVFHRYGKSIAGGNSLILDEIHQPQKIIPVRLAPMVFVSTVATHLFGGSAGREGTAVQMGATLADQVATFFRVRPEERKILLMAGAGAGFGAGIGAPFAGMIFGMEVIHIGRLKFFAWLECLVAAFAGYGVTLWLHAPHSVFTRVAVVSYNTKTFIAVAFLGMLCGLVAWIFVKLTHVFEKGLARLTTVDALKPFLAGILIVVLYHAEGSFQYAGLGIPVIQQALVQPAEAHVFVLKILFTVLTVGAGFKGGEFVPLVYIGTTLGSALSLYLPVDTQILAALGFAAVFAGAANTPLACTLMVMEIFGAPMAGYGFLACFFSYHFSGHRGIYKAQRVLHKKILSGLKKERRK